MNSMSAAAYHNIIVIFPSALFPFVVAALLKGFYLLLTYVFPVIMALNCHQTNCMKFNIRRAR